MSRNLRFLFKQAFNEVVDKLQSLLVTLVQKLYDQLLNIHSGTPPFYRKYARMKQKEENTKDACISASVSRVYEKEY